MVLPLVRHFPAQGQVFGLCRIRFPARHRLLCLGAQVLWYRNEPCHVRCPVLVDVTGISVWRLGRCRRLLRRGSHCKEHYQSEKCLHPAHPSKTSSAKKLGDRIVTAATREPIAFAATETSHPCQNFHKSRAASGTSNHHASPNPDV